MKIKVKIFIILVWLIILFVVMKNIFTRIQWQKKFDKTLFAIYFDKKLYTDVETEIFKEKVKSVNIKTIVLNWDEDFLNNFEYFKKEGFNFIIKIFPDKRYNFSEIENFISANLELIKSITLEPLSYKLQNIKSYKIGADYLIAELAEIIKNNNLWCINFEFDEFPIGKIFKIKNKVLRGFVLDFNLAKKDYVIKVRKAVRERSCRIVYLAPSEFLSLEKNLEIVNNIVDDNKKYFTTYWNLEKYETINFGEYANFFIIVFYICSIIFCYKFFLKNVNVPEITFLLINIYIVFCGVIIYGLLQDYDYVVLNKDIVGVRAMFLLPIIFLPFVIFKKNEINNFLNYNLKIRDMIFFVILLLLLYYVILRIGNVSKNLVLTIELQIRNFIENIILFRPRFKEILFGQPLLIFSLKMIKKSPRNNFGKIFLWASVVAPVSVLNTFLHIHTPIHISLLRTFTGMTIGFLIGELIFFCWENVVNFYLKRL